MNMQEKYGGTFGYDETFIPEITLRQKRQATAGEKSYSSRSAASVSPAARSREVQKRVSNRDVRIISPKPVVEDSKKVS